MNDYHESENILHSTYKDNLKSGNAKFKTIWGKSVAYFIPHNFVFIIVNSLIVKAEHRANFM